VEEDSVLRSANRKLNILVEMTLGSIFRRPARLDFDLVEATLFETKTRPK
jgi:hypothetical protein